MDWMRTWKNRFHNKQMEVRYGREMYRLAVEYEKRSGEENGTGIDSDIPGMGSYVEKSRVLDRGYDRVLKSGKYDEQHMLAVINPYCQAPLTALLLFVTEAPCRVRVYVEDGKLYSYTSEAVEEHRLPVFGLHAGRENQVTVEMLGKKGEVTFTQCLYLYTKSLPKLLTDMICVKKHTQESAIPFTFVYGGDSKYPYAFDENGEIRYYLSRNPKAYGLFPLSGGRFLFLIKRFSAPSFANPHSVLCQEMDFFGRVVREYYVPDGIHHDGCEMVPGGNLLVASSSHNEWVEDTVVEIERESGRIVKRFCLADALSDHPYFDFFDWAHLNTVSYRPDNHSVLVCMRNLHTVMELDWETNEIHWLLSDPAVWKGTVYENKVLQPVGDISWFYQAHASYWMPDQEEGKKRQLIIYDNHWHKRRPMASFDKDKKSYVRIYEIDEEKKTVSLKQSYGNIKSKIRSNGIVKDDRVFSMSGYLNEPVGEYDGIITEFSRDSGKVINQYYTYNSFYRAYPFFADYDALSQPISWPEKAVLGTDVEVWKTYDKDILSNAVRQPWFRLPRRHTKRARKHTRKEERMKNYDEELVLQERKSQICRVKISFYGDFLLVLGRDHLVNKVFLEGTDCVYEADYSRTEQKSPALFSRSWYHLAMPVCHLPKGDYGIYFETDGVIYRTGKKFSIC